MLALFVTSTLDGWTNLYHFAMDAAPEPHHQPLRESAFPGPLVLLRASSTLTLTLTLTRTPTPTPTPTPDPNPSPSHNPDPNPETLIPNPHPCPDLLRALRHLWRLLPVQHLRRGRHRPVPG